MKPTFPGLKALLLSLRPTRGSADIAALRARALFQPPESAMTKRRRSLLEFLGQVSLFEDPFSGNRAGFVPVHQRR
jgi:hypothetical protein